jgi:3-methyladenine DNA glycosylase AlkC
MKLVRSTDPNLRRFVSESLRPVVENRWFHNQPEYAVDIIHHLFQESDPYPRTSVGNNLSDWMRVDQETIWPIVVKLAKNGDKNSYWIAYRACRNYVKKQPAKVMDLLQVNEYKYKNRIHKREDLST